MDAKVMIMIDRAKTIDYSSFFAKLKGTPFLFGQ